MEEYCYDSSGQLNGNFTTYSPAFTLLSNAIVAWMNINRETLLKDKFTIFNGYYALHLMYTLDAAKLPTYADAAIFTIGPNDYFNSKGYRAGLLDRALTYYDDYDDGGGTTVNLTADTDYINAVTIETINTDTLLADIQAQSSINALDDIPVKVIPTKTMTTTYIFDTMGYENVINNLNTGAITIPDSYYYAGASLITETYETWFGYKYNVGASVVSQSATQAHAGTYSLVKSAGVDGTDYSYKILPKAIDITNADVGYRLTSYVYKDTLGGNDTVEFGLTDINMNGYTINIDHFAETLSIEKRTAAVGTIIGTASDWSAHSTNLVTEWYKIELDITIDGLITVSLYDGTSILIDSLTVTDTSYTILHTLFISGGSTYYLDDLAMTEL